MLAKEEELVKVKERQVQAEEQLKEYETKQKQVSITVESLSGNIVLRLNDLFSLS